MLRVKTMLAIFSDRCQDENGGLGAVYMDVTAPDGLQGKELSHHWPDRKCGMLFSFVFWFQTKKNSGPWTTTPFLSREWREAGREGLKLPNLPPHLVWNALSSAFWCTLKDQHTTLSNTRTGSSWLPCELLKSTFLHTFHIPTTSRSCFLQWPARLPLPTYILSCGSHMLIVSPLAMPKLISCSPICLSELSSLCFLLATCPSYAASQKSLPHFFLIPFPKLHPSWTLRTAD